MSSWLHGALRGSPCRTYSPDLRVRLSETGMHAYPDVTVVCGGEVLSSSTEAYDRGAKAAHHRQRATI